MIHTTKHKALKGLYGANTKHGFDKALIIRHPHRKEKMDLKVHYERVHKALQESQPFYVRNNRNLPDPWWHILKIVSNICKHSRNLEIGFDARCGSDEELWIQVPFHGIDSISPSLFYGCFPGRMNVEIIAASELIYTKLKERKSSDKTPLKEKDVKDKDGVVIITTAELQSINDSWKGVHGEKMPLMKDFSVCKLIRTAVDGFRGIVTAIDESKKTVDEMHALARGERVGDLREYLNNDLKIPMDALNLRRESCYHLCAKRGDVEQLHVLVEDKNALERALFQQDREHKRTPLHYMYLNHFSDGIKLVQDNMDAATFQIAMGLKDKDGKTPGQCV